MNPLPPQAYTKDTLVKSYNWLALQGPHIKELATTTDVMVSLYLKAQRDGLSSLENPSIQNFKNELKTLTTMLGNFDVEEGAITAKNSNQQTQIQNQVQNQVQNQQSQSSIQNSKQDLNSSQNTDNPNLTDLQPPSGATSQSVSSHQDQNHQSSRIELQMQETLDQKSILMIQDIKNFYNLSSDTEALRMLIKIGYIKAVGFYKSL